MGEDGCDTGRERRPVPDAIVTATLTRYSLEVAQLSETVPRRRRTSGLDFASLPGAQFTVFAHQSPSPASPIAASASSIAASASSKPPKKATTFTNARSAPRENEVFCESASTSLSQASSFASAPSRDVPHSDIFQDRRFRRRAVYRREVCNASGVDWVTPSALAMEQPADDDSGDGNAGRTGEWRPLEARCQSTPAANRTSISARINPSVATSFIHTRKPMSAPVERLQGLVRVGTFMQRTRYLRLINHALVCHRRSRTGTVVWTAFVSPDVRLRVDAAKVVLCFPEGRIVHLRFLSASTAAHWAEVIRAAAGGKSTVRGLN